MRQIIGINDIWGDLPPEYAAKVASNVTKGNVVNIAVTNIYGDLDYIFSERVKFPLRKGNIQEIANKSEYSHIKNALSFGRKIPVVPNGDILEIPIRYGDDSIALENIGFSSGLNFLYLHSGNTHNLIVGDKLFDNNNIIYTILDINGIELRLDKPIFDTMHRIYILKDTFEIQMVVIPKSFLDKQDEDKLKINIDTRIKSLLQSAIVCELLRRENDQSNPQNVLWKDNYKEDLERFGIMHGNMQDTDQIWTNQGNGIPDFRF